MTDDRLTFKALLIYFSSLFYSLGYSFCPFVSIVSVERHLICKISHSLGFANCMFMVQFNMFLRPCIS